MGTKSIRLLAASIALSAGVALASPAGIHPNVAVTPLPDGVVEHTIDPGEARDDPSGVTHRLVDDQLLLAPGGELRRFYRHAYTIETRAALEERSSRSIDFEPSYQRVEIHRLALYRDGRWEDRIASADWQLLRREEELERQMFDRRLTLLALLDDVREGETLDIAYSVVGHNPVFDRRLVGAYDMGWYEPVDRRYLRVRHAASREVDFRVLGDAPLPREREQGAWRELVWDLSTEAYDYPPGIPYDWIVHPWIELSEFESWADVVRWGRPLYERAIETSGRLAEVVAAIENEARDGADRAVLARNWVQDEIRYLAMLMGEHSHTPHAVSKVLDSRSGDCKDKSTTLVALLRAMGYEAWPALVHSSRRDAIAAALPSPAAFDHVIVAVDTDRGRFWIDPTLRLQGGATLEESYVPDYGRALVLAPGVDDLETLPDRTEAHGETHAVYRYEIAELGGPVEVEIETRYTGRQADNSRNMVAASSRKELLDSYADYYGSSVNTIEPLELEVEDDRRANTLTIVERYRMTQHFEDNSQIWFDALPLLMSGDLAFPASRARTIPLAQAHPVRRTERIEIAMQKPGTPFGEFDERVESKWFRFEVESRPLANGIRLDYSFETLADRVQPSLLDDYVDALNRFDNGLGYGIAGASSGDSSLAAVGVVALFICLLFAGMCLLAAVVIVIWTR